jgi:hypothetical protein
MPGTALNFSNAAKQANFLNAIAIFARLLRLRPPQRPSTPPRRDLSERPGTIPGYYAGNDPTYGQQRGPDPRFQQAAETLARALGGK